jgi:hypothetical protein
MSYHVCLYVPDDPHDTRKRLQSHRRTRASIHVRHCRRSLRPPGRLPAASATRCSPHHSEHSSPRGKGPLARTARIRGIWVIVASVILVNSEVNPPHRVDRDSSPVAANQRFSSTRVRRKVNAHSNRAVVPPRSGLLAPKLDLSSRRQVCTAWRAVAGISVE